MKYVLIFVLLFPLLSFAQEKNDNLIIVSASDSSNLYDRIVNLLNTEGYKLSKPDRNSGFIYTKDKTIGKYRNSVCNYSFRIDGNTISISGRWFVDFYHQGKIANDKWSSFLAGWNEMDRLAKLLGTVTYSKEN